MSSWETQKGDEWCYESGTIRAAGDLNSADCVFIVRDIVSANGEVTEKALLRFLNETRECFSESRIFIKQFRLDVRLKKILTSLQQQGLINYQISGSPQPLIEVISMQAKKGWSLW
jgi:hypothetical protein